MKIFSTITSLKEEYKNIVMAMGTFDGVHAGHQRIIKKAVNLAREINGTSVVFTFSNHPLSIINPKNRPLMITDNKRKEEWIEELGADVMLHVPFTSDLLHLSPIAFIRLLKKHIEPCYIVVGPNFSFGSGGKGTPDMLIRKENEFGYKTIVNPIIQKGQQTVSSTLIRSLISGGDINTANYLLNRRFSIVGKVVKGDQRGRTMGFPTANIDIDMMRLAPANGVYAAEVIIERKHYNAVVNVGINPTFNGITRHIEAHIIGFSGDIYGEEIEIIFLDRIRSERKFNNIDDLIGQIKKDTARANEICSLLTP
jgi:riboflavin kinase/FMN adenylyltransferase